MFLMKRPMVDVSSIGELMFCNDLSSFWSTKDWERMIDERFFYT